MTGMFVNADSVYYVLLYYFYETPKLLSFAIPFGVLAGSVLTGLSFASTNEWTSARAAGYSMKAACVPLFMGGLCWAILSGVVSETAAPRAAIKSHEVRSIRLEKKSTAKRSTLQKWFRGPSSIAQIGRYNATARRVSGLRLEKLDSNFRPFEVISAETATPVDSNLWLLQGVQWTKISGQQQNKVDLPRMEIQLPFRESQLVTDRKRESEYSVGELSEIIAQRKFAGAEIVKPRFEMHSKIALILFTVLLPLGALRFAYAGERSSSQMGAVVRVFLVAGVYWVALSIIRAFVLQTKVLPVAAWLPFLLAAMYLAWDYRGAATKSH